MYAYYIDGKNKSCEIIFWNKKMISLDLVIHIHITHVMQWFFTVKSQDLGIYKFRRFGQNFLKTKKGPIDIVSL